MPQSVILISDVPGLGQLGDVCKVKEGYARNYLIPQKLAVHATSDALKRFERQKGKLTAEREKQLARSQTLAERLSKVGLVFERPVGPGGRMFGSVSPLDIVGDLAKQEITIEKRCVLMNGPLKAIGDHTVRIRLHSQVIVDVPVKIVGKEVKEDTEHELEPQPEEKQTT